MIEPANQRLLILEDKDKDTSPGGIVLLTKTEKGLKRGTVVGASADSKFIGRLTFGTDRVLIPEHSTVPIEDSDGVKYALIRDDDVLAWI